MTSAFIIWWAVFIGLICFLVYIASLTIKVFSRYVFDGGDFRSPYILSMFALSIFSICELFFFLLTGETTIFLKVLSQYYLFIIVTYLIKSRLLCYPSVYINKTLKNYLHYLVSIIFLVIIYVSLISFEIINFPIASIQTWEQIKLYVSVINTSFSLDNFFIFLSSIIFLIIMIWFDKSEKRTSKVKYDYLLFISIFIVFLSGLNIFQQMPVIIQFLLSVVHFYFPVLLIIKDAHSIIRHSKDIDVRVNSTKKILDFIANSKSFSKTDEFQLKYIAKLCAEDQSFSDLVLNRKILNKKYRKLYKHIKELQNR
jgi:hypothetical protein